MAVERHAAALLLKLYSEGFSFGRVLTLGHQNLYLELAEYRRILERVGRGKVAAVPTFADDLFFALGASDVQAMDFSSYEGAQVVHDLNQPVPTEWHQRYDTVFDGGTLEHIFNFPTAINNCMKMVKAGGRFISVTIPNNWCGHGFYQFSPELFYRIFVPENGFSVLEMYVAESHGHRTYAVKDPAVVRSRIELCNSTPVFLLVHARRDTVGEVFAEAPQQSDYVAGWSVSPAQKEHPIAGAWDRFPFHYLRTIRRNLFLRRHLRKSSLANREFYTPVDLRI